MESGKCSSPAVESPSTSPALSPGRRILPDGLTRHLNPDLAGFVQIVFSMNDPKVHERLLQVSGIADVEVTIIPTAIRLPPPQQFMWQYISLTPMGATVSQAPEGAQDALEDNIVASGGSPSRRAPGCFTNVWCRSWMHIGARESKPTNSEDSRAR